MAIKTLSGSGAPDPEGVRRFETEARAAGTLDHPNLLVVYDVGREGAQRRDQDEERHRQDPTDPPGVEATEADPAARAVEVAHEDLGDQVAGEDEEDVDSYEAPTHQRAAGVEGDDEVDGERADAVERRTVLRRVGGGSQRLLVGLAPHPRPVVVGLAGGR